ncbi:MAG: hypothetical protein AB1609_17315, partial [Bacillota bacterium]
EGRARGAGVHVAHPGVHVAHPKEEGRARGAGVHVAHPGVHVAHPKEEGVHVVQGCTWRTQPPGISNKNPPHKNPPQEEEIPNELAAFDSELRRLPGYHPTPGFYQKVLEKYGQLDLLEEAVGIASWFDTPSKRFKPTPRAAGRQCSTLFVLRWLARSLAQLQEDHGRPRHDAATRANRLGADQGQPRGEDPGPGVHGLEQRDTIR